MLHIQSVESGVYDLLRREIVELQLKPGERLGLEELASLYGVSHMPVRQALRRLESEGLVSTIHRRGSRVAPLTFEELEEIQVIRLGVDPFLAHLGAEIMREETLLEMERRLQEVDQAFAHGDVDAYLKAQAGLRDVCHANAGRPRLLKVSLHQRSRAERYIRFVCSDLDALAESRQHQADLLDACRARSGSAAEEATRHALTWTLVRVGSLLDETRLEFADILEEGAGPPGKDTAQDADQV